MKFVTTWLLILLCALPVRANDLPELGDASAQVVTPQQMKQIGESIMRQIRASKQYVEDPEITDYVNSLGFALVASSPEAQQPFEFFVIEDASVNAFALPGGFIGVFTGLILTAQSESELASVLGHEIAHVTQHHLARLFAQQQRAGMASLAAIALALLAAHSSPDLAQAAMAGAQYAMYQTQINFTRDNEREADRVGLQILDKAGFDPRAMPVFLDRLQRSYRIYETNAPSYSRTHPLTYERIADVQNRVEGIPYRQVPDSLEFQLVRARLHSAQYEAREAIVYFEDILTEKKAVTQVPARYGLILALMRTKDFKRANQEMVLLRTDVPDNAMITALEGRLKRAAGDNKGALELYSKAIERYPRQRALIYDYARALLDAQRPKEALRLVSDALALAADDRRLYSLQAESYAALGQRMQQHRAQAEAYLLIGSIPAAIEQLQLAVKSKDGDFYQMSSAEARLKELRAIDEANRKRR